MGLSSTSRHLTQPNLYKKILISPPIWLKFGMDIPNDSPFPEMVRLGHSYCRMVGCRSINLAKIAISESILLEFDMDAPNGP
jgi:hypothetical protein